MEEKTVIKKNQCEGLGMKHVIVKVKNLTGGLNRSSKEESVNQKIRY